MKVNRSFWGEDGKVGNWKEVVERIRQRERIWKIAEVGVKRVDIWKGLGVSWEGGTDRKDLKKLKIKREDTFTWVEELGWRYDLIVYRFGDILDEKEEVWTMNCLLEKMEEWIKRLRPGGFLCFSLWEGANVKWKKGLMLLEKLAEFRSNCEYVGCMEIETKQKEFLMFWQKRKIGIDEVKPIRSWLSYFTDMKVVRKTVKNLEEKLKNKEFRKKLGEKIIWRIEVGKNSFVEWLEYEGKMFIPFVCFHISLNELEERYREFFKKKIIISRQEIVLLIDIPERVDGVETLKFKGKYWQIMGSDWSADFGNYFNDYRRWVCHRKQIDSMWRVYLENYKMLSALGSLYEIDRTTRHGLRRSAQCNK